MAAPYHAVEHTACSGISIMPTREEQQDPKQAPKGRIRSAGHDDARDRDRDRDRDQEEARERSHLDPLADDNPAICRGID